ncbi:hypothetical protein Pmar_PMAR003027 [Perkinsus marinus ATCC 50983]|uniref:Uncharacterized protein n=1 Tax=Perkinsus marinus (strain ATCC 50983 / TXsc) TaxID=423536 RepID=C5LR71_PERM5|nr:hypothetical protein Pmar_PMAR003027 [Perkinsus marinus ATCC 50983]EER00956.1 hypothetical protein Pmar_PMAR003027 [Perkinsus marinus ATCC 50983]|eukprot:XP_002768238.1 hypothetical protein Pmar_PMAR003027 [Perkinsus marinus ATCC 50983]
MKLSLATGKDLVRLATAFADASISDVALFDRLGVHLSGVIHTLTVGVLVDALLAFARLRMRHDLLLLKASDVLASKIGQLDPEQLCHVAFVYGRFEQVHPSLHEALESRMGKIFVLTPQGGSGYPTHGPLPIPSLCDLTISVAILDLQWIGQRAYLEEMFSAVDWDEISLPGSISSRSVGFLRPWLGLGPILHYQPLEEHQGVPLRGTSVPRYAESYLLSRIAMKNCVEGSVLCDDLDKLPADLRDEDPYQLSIIKYICLSGHDFALDGDLSNYTKLRLHALIAKAGWPRVVPLSSKNWRTATDKLNYLHQATANGEGYTD